MNTRSAGNAVGDTQHPTHNADNPAVEAGMSSNIINIGLNIFRAAIKKYEEPEQELLEWLWGYTFDVLGHDRASLERELNFDYRTIYQILTGTYAGPLDAFCAAVVALKAKAAAKMPLVETIVVKRMIEALNYARDFRAMVTIQGPTGRGKTYTAKYWARMNNHGRTRYIRVPSGCSRRSLTIALCQQCGIGTAGVKQGRMEQRLFSAFSEKNVIIVDEAGHLIPRTGGSTAAIELLRDIHDICNCSVVMIFTDVYLKEIKNGPSADYFEQFIGRIKYALEIPNRVYKTEVEEVVKHFVPDPSEKLILYAHEQTLQRSGKLRMLFEDLIRAAEWAREQKHKLGIEDLKTAIKWRQSGGLWPEE